VARSSWRILELVTAAGASLLVLAVAWSGAASGQDDPASPDLLKSAPFDRITLNDGTVLNIEPVSPRPLPPYDPKKDTEAARKAAEAAKIREPNIFTDKEKEAKAAYEKRQREREKAVSINEINVKPLDSESLYRVRRANIKTIEYYEDLLLAAGERFLKRRDFARAFEHYLAVQQRAPGWKGLVEHVEQLLFEEGSAAIFDGDTERGLRLLRELRERRPNYPGLADQLAKAYRGRIERSLKSGTFAEGRRLLHEVAQLSPDHEVVREMTGRYVARAKAAADRAAADSDPAGRVDALAGALRIWPGLEGAAERYRAAFAELPTLDVAVLDLPKPVGPWIRSPADARTSRLFYLPLLAQTGEDALRGKVPGQLAASLETADLGRRVTITLREGPAWDDGSGPVSAVDVVRSLAERARPGSPQYQARWAHLLRRIEPADARTIVLNLERTTLKPEAWLLGPIGPAHAGSDGQVATGDGSHRTVGDGPFRVAGIGGDQASYLAIEGPSGSAAPRIRRVREVRLPNGPAALRALRRGEVTLVEHVPPHRVAELRRDQELRVGRYADPRMHLIALDGRTPALRNRTLRRGLTLAIDRKTILEEHVLRRPPDETNRPSDGLFPRGSYADAPDVRPLESDRLLARMLVAAARKEMGDSPIRLKFEYPDRPDVHVAVPRIVEALKSAGLEIEPVPRPEAELEAALRAGRRFDLAYRVATCPEPLADVGPLVCPGYDASPSEDALSSVASPRTLQLLLQVEHASEFPTARGLVIQLDRESRDELPIIPLWQLDDHYAWRARLEGPGETAAGLYDGIGGWEVEPWFARDPW
jgi:peptide/nickel transport system substrate-binding protein